MQCSVTPQMFWSFRRQTLGGKSAVTGAALPLNLEDCNPEVQADHYAQACYAFASYELANQSLASISSLLDPLAIVPTPSGVPMGRAEDIRASVIRRMLVDHGLA
jgi:hypothetical protein